MKKFLALSSAFALLISAVSCSSKTSTDISESPPIETVTISQTAYKETKIHLPAQCKTPCISLHTAGEKSYFFYMDRDNKCCLSVVNDAGEIEDNVTLFDTKSLSYTACVRDDGTFTVLRMDTDFPLEFDEYGRMTNYLEFRQSDSFTFYLDEYSADRQLVSECEVPELAEEYDASSSNLASICPYGDGRYIVSLSNKLAIIDTAGNVVDMRDHAPGGLELTSDRDGNIIAADGGSFGYLDGTTAQLPDNMFSDYGELHDLMMYRDAPIAKGCGGFKAFIQLRDGIYGLTDDEELLLVFSFTDSFVKQSDMFTFAAMGDGKFISAAEGDILRLYTRQPDDYSTDRENVNVWMIDGGVSSGDPIGFAKANDKYTVTVEQNNKTLDDMVKAVLIDEGPDVIVVPGSYVIDKLKKFGALADMSSLMAEYGGIQRDDLMPNVVEAMDDGGHIYALPETFSIRSCFAAADYIGKEYVNWTYDDLYRLYNDRPDGMYLTTNTFGGTFNLFATSNIEAWLDETRLSCRFDSPEFIKLLEFCKANEDSVFSEHADTADTEDTLYKKQLFSSLRDHNAMVCAENSFRFGLSDILRATSDKGLDLDSATFMNMPNSGGTGTMAINIGYGVMEKSKCKEGAWAYISYLLGEEHQCESAEYYNFGWNFANKAAFEKSLSAMICDGDTPERYTVHFTDSDGISFEYEAVKNVTKKQADAYRDFVLNCTRFAITSPDIVGIMSEEYDSYCGGECTVEECAERIQDRVSIYLSENS